MTNKIQPLIPGNTDGLEEIARQLLEGIPADDTNGGSGLGGSLEVHTSKDFWTITGANYRGKSVTVDLLKSLLDKGNARIQDQWVEYSKQAKTRKDFYVGDFPLYHAVFRALYQNKDSLTDKTRVEEARTFLEKQFNEKWLMTLTRVRHMPKVRDTVIHNFGMPDKIEILEDFVGGDEWVKDTITPQVYNTLLGNNNIQEIQDIYKWITKKPAYLYRVNSKPHAVSERIARFGAGSGWAYLSCNGDPAYTYSSLGVRVH